MDATKNELFEKRVGILFEQIKQWFSDDNRVRVEERKCKYTSNNYDGPNYDGPNYDDFEINELLLHINNRDKFVLSFLPITPDTLFFEGLINININDFKDDKLYYSESPDVDSEGWRLCINKWINRKLNTKSQVLTKDILLFVINFDETIVDLSKMLDKVTKENKHELIIL